MGRGPLLKRIATLITEPCSSMITFGINSRFQELFPTWGQVTHAFLTLAPLRYCYLRSTCMPNPCRQRSFWARIKLSKQKYLTTRVVLYLWRTRLNPVHRNFYVPDLLLLTTVPQSFDLKTWLKAHRTIQFSKNIDQLPGLYQTRRKTACYLI